MRVRMIAVCLALAASSVVATAQMAMGANAGPAAGTIAAPSKAVDSQLSLIETEMMGAVKAMPAEKFGFAAGLHKPPEWPATLLKLLRVFR